MPFRRRSSNNNGQYRSKSELIFASDLTKRGIPYKYESESYQYRSTVRGGRCTDCSGKRVYRQSRYTPDFRINETFFVETKGRLTSKDRTKLLCVKECNPSLDLRLVFFSNNKLNKNSNTRYTDWAEKHGFKYHVGKSLPEEWAR